MSSSRNNSIAGHFAATSRERLVEGDIDAEYNESHKCETILQVLSLIIIVMTFPVSLLYCVAVVKEVSAQDVKVLQTMMIMSQYERVVIFRMGRIAPGCPKGPGLFFVIPCLDSLVKVDLRTFNFAIPQAEVMLKVRHAYTHTHTLFNFRPLAKLFNLIGLDTYNRGSRCVL